MPHEIMRKLIHEVDVIVRYKPRHHLFFRPDQLELAAVFPGKYIMHDVGKPVHELLFDEYLTPDKV